MSSNAPKTPEQLSFDKEYPISLKEINTILNRVYDRYPALSRYEITLIVKSLLETMRWLLISGKTISINNFAANMKFISFSKFIGNKHCKVIKMKLSTPWRFK